MGRVKNLTAAIVLVAIAAPAAALCGPAGFVRLSQAPTPKTLERFPGEVLGLTDRYFAALDRGATQVAYGMMHADLKAKASFNRFQSSEKNRQKTEGPLRDRSILRISWSESGARPGIYASVDYSASYRNLPRECGVVVWYRPANGDFQLIRHDRNPKASDADCGRNGLALR